LNNLNGISRRFLMGGAFASGVNSIFGKSAYAACQLTAKQPEGPFFPAHASESDLDMTNMSGGTGRALGDLIEVSGQVRDSQCYPVPGCNLEIWQANAKGRYAHPKDRNNNEPLDPNFQGYAHIVTDRNGNYRFVTIVPGSYRANGDWVRPSHIHFKVKGEFSTLTTQMYFDGEPHNSEDYLLNALELQERRTVIVKFDQARADGIKRGKFNLVIANR